MQHIARCGFDCCTCPVYTATVRNDDAMKQQLAREYSTTDCLFTPEDMTCAGCLSPTVDNSKMCGPCEMRTCAKEKSKTCATCTQYPCETVNRLMPPDTAGRKRLDALH